MMDSDNYPAGLTDNSPNCPWSEHENDDKEYPCIVTETLSKEIFVATKNYHEYEDVDDEGHYDHWYEFDNVDWKEEYITRESTLKDILDKCVDVFEKVEQYCTKDFLLGSIDDNVLQDIRLLKEECDGWVSHEIEVECDD